VFCADTSCWIPYLAGESGPDVDLISTHLRKYSLVMSPVVLAELLSDPLPSQLARQSLIEIPALELITGFWERAGKTRADLIKRRFKPKLADTLIAQICIDHNLPLHTRDTDFRPFAKYAGLQLVLHSLLN
jgi:predicted nucleic acid-binding protein